MLIKKNEREMPAAGGDDVAVALFLFAHQDDEFAIFQKIAEEKQKGRRVVCIYFTSGVPAGGDATRRNDESRGVLQEFGIAAGDIHFAGEQLDIPDGGLQEHIFAAADYLETQLDLIGTPASVYLLAWEGGHPDHDVLHACSLHVLHDRGLLPLVRQFALYNNYHCPWQFFRVMSPLAANGPVEATPISWRQRIRFLSYCLRYPTQRVTWIGLFPFVLWHFVLNGRQQVQAASIARIGQAPHGGTLYYEKRQFSTWKMVDAKLKQWLAARF